MVCGVVASGAVLAGCVVPAAAVAGAGLTAAQEGVAVWVRGELRTAMRQPMSDVRAAALAALEDLGFEVGEENAGERKVYIEAHADDGSRVSVRVFMVTEVITGLRIRAGMVGDREVASLILLDMKQRFQADAVYQRP